MTNNLSHQLFAIMRAGFTVLVPLTLYCAPSLALAVQRDNILVKVTVLRKPCVIKGGNGSDMIEVNFGNDVMTTHVDGTYKTMPVSYSVTCFSSSNAIKMQIEGVGATFDSGVLTTNQTDFGIALKVNNTLLPINSWINLTYPNMPTLTAVPVKRAGATLTGGTFSSSATLKVEYQ